MYLFEGLKESASGYLEPDQVELLKQAYQVARDAHEGQMRTSGEPYITHPVAVARILADMRLDHETLMAALLHDTIEDTSVTKDELAELFSESIAELVEGVSKLDKLKFRDKKEAQAENFRKMMMAMTQDIRVILIKLADRTHNMRTLGALRPDKRRRIARETLEIYAPIANRLGIHNIKIELEDLGFQAYYPMRYRVLKEVVKAARGNRKELIQSIEAAVHTRLEDTKIPGTVKGREKNLYSIYNKMRSKELQFQEVMDIYAFRVIVDSIDTCYRVMGAMHGLYKPRPGRFKDYIAIPKANGYQSLHTSLFGPHGVPVEIQIRTEDMDQMADKGVAAHWVYKKDSSTEQGTTTQVRARKWMQSLLELQQSASTSFEFVENFKTELFPEEIYVFTPEGRILELPVGATPVDFAYAVHTDVGNTCVGARVNRQAYPLSQPLISGQTVEIMTAKGARPNAAWLNFVVTGKARAKIRQLLKSLKEEDAVILGKRLLNHALGETKLDMIPAERIDKVVSETKHNTLDELLIDIGLGNAMSIVIAQRLKGDQAQIPHEHKESNMMPIRGAEGMLVTFANCCRPIPGDAVIAHVSPGKGLVVHMESCANIRGYQGEPDKYIPVQWDNTEGAEFQANLRVEIVNHQGALAKITSIVAAGGANIHNLSTEERDGRVFLINLRISVTDRVHLANVMRRIRVLPEVLRTSRNR
ncbi:bifunctional GTP diphosphokinase/guanosine-3',5'-bis pyrophosphate 3'-pyrophosphohydrolase [Shewanella sp. D64]|uniref:bifunctional GTP diphosphokinase/guanosine-3',5'-bis pyrophosphate 3'-pyrophosphohydrolase n=1 Tax=unclassified Shewanella TaxID=196818 RepID=UPI0022BA47D2|nr:MULTISPECIES: bifunctional GTP diphosphokinase/guanosine-3',5'-bis pyrophosphate 3'-pyrophosphohydrolase [unclassified Shewanella]MEC4726827.1 bifunctional GTP diphosphokinase/guanosine-3',5'-bis pyrophosphate 3'-pyrophosphohydrolase [Shewanella sp. D64]MEC4739061.1 bifunctional GTP diphosphokinase/guanosine-3',5'-bis pyrophosphate 3'-pyrophosphohydrolase [Shewanella sp. E94]WBJ95917.1 bifunctional GTP diphosphokinase/guanosine-3',5'-bis pyrophosphate 3'-pyrophosphohydrolase [Shewanella sp. M